MVSVLVPLLPLAACLLAGSMRSSLWLDEVLYYHWERHPEVRAIEMGSPGSFWARIVGPYFYCDLQRAVHGLFDAVGFAVWKSPELYLRLPSLAYFVASVLLLYAVARRAGADRAWASGVALAFGSTPAFLFYAFEARVYSLGALLVILFLAAFARCLENDRARTVLTAGSLGLAMVWAVLWNVCLLGAIALSIPLLVARRAVSRRTGARLALLVGVGLIFVAVQTAYVFSLKVPGQHGIPLFDRQPLGSLLLSTIHGPFLGMAEGRPEIVLALLLAIAFFRMRGKGGWALPISVAIALAASVFLMFRNGWGISPRHQTALYAGIFASFALMRGEIVSRTLLASVVGWNLLFLGETAERIRLKANSRQIAQVIGSGERLRRFPVVVQHSYNLGYPDPLHSFGLSFYLDTARPDRVPVPILELPTHRDVRGLLLDREYFMNGREKLKLFSRSPREEWIASLRALPGRALWFVTPIGPRNLEQKRRYESALESAGFARVRGIPERFEGYPETEVALWERSGGGRATAPAPR